MVHLMPLPPQNPIDHLFMVPVYPGCPGKEVIKHVVCVYYRDICAYKRRLNLTLVFCVNFMLSCVLLCMYV